MSIDIAHLNWFETLGNNTSTNIKRFIGRTAKLLALKLFGKKIVWTMHNRIPHDQKNIILKKNMMRLIIWLSDVIIIHSKVSEAILISEYNVDKRKIRHIPHPDYIDSYQPFKASAIGQKSDNILYLLFLGAVKPYKNIELLIDVVKQYSNDVVLTIAGNASNGSYRDYIKEYAKASQNIKLHLQFIPDDMLTTYIEDCDLLALPYDIKSSLNSGTVILAFSNARTVICPNIGTVCDVSDKSMVLSYDYLDKEEHFDMISKKLNEAIEMKKKNKAIFKELGNTVLNEVSYYNKKEKVINDFIQEYNLMLKIR